MIGRLQGILLEKQAGEVLLDVNGVGYEVEVPDGTWHQLPEAGQGAVLFTHFVVREDAQHLYGFAEREDRTLFRMLIRVNGVGPKMALGLLSGMGGAEFAACVARNDLAALVKLPGVGKKTAERLLIEMRDKLRDWQPELTVSAGARPAARSASSAADEAEAALLSLGYRPQEASRAVMQVLSDLEDSESAPQTEQIIRMALKNLGKS